MMRSNEIARLAGISVRAIRHYHEIGLLAEPPRQSNGYRAYGVEHFIRLLSIGRLKALGIQLANVSDILKNTPKQSLILDNIDRSLERKIEILQKQKQMLSALREGGGPIDIPTEFAGALTSLEVGRVQEANKAGREQAILFDHLFDRSERAKIAKLFDQLAGPTLAQIAGELGRRYDALGPGTAPQTINSLAAAYVERLGDWLSEFEAVVLRSSRRDTGSLLWLHAATVANGEQQMLIVKVSELIREKWP
jgi:DNA-binding transcriptional MerR regulator